MTEINKIGTTENGRFCLNVRVETNDKYQNIACFHVAGKKWDVRAHNATGLWFDPTPQPNCPKMGKKAKKQLAKEIKKARCWLKS